MDSLDLFHEVSGQRSGKATAQRAQPIYRSLGNGPRLVQQDNKDMAEQCQG
jgi:hypothetical protein